MSISRWGAFSVIDHRNDRQLATEVLIYDHLLIPTPMAWDLARWKENGWDPEGLKRKLDALGDIAIEANWDQDRQKDWKKKFKSLAEDQQEINAAMEMTRRVLIDQNRKYRPAGIDLVEVFSAYQSRADFLELEPSASADRQVRDKIARTNLILSHRLSIPDEEEDAEILKRALDLAHKPAFRQARSEYYNWQHEILGNGHLPEDAASAMVKLVKNYNSIVEASGRKFRRETVVLFCSVLAAGLATAAGLFPGSFEMAGMGPLAGAQVVQIGGFASGAVIQVAEHVAGKKESGHEQKNVGGAMFHQVERDLKWTLA